MAQNLLKVSESTVFQSHLESCVDIFPVIPQQPRDRIITIRNRGHWHITVVRRRNGFFAATPEEVRWPRKTPQPFRRKGRGILAVRLILGWVTAAANTKDCFFLNDLFLWREWHWQKWTTIWSSAHNKALEKGHPALVRPNKSIKSLSCSRSITVALMTQTAKTSAK